MVNILAKLIANIVIQAIWHIYCVEIVNFDFDFEKYSKLKLNLFYLLISIKYLHFCCNLKMRSILHGGIQPGDLRKTLGIAAL